MARATSSLPVPDSPSTSTVASVAATAAIWRCTSRSFGAAADQLQRSGIGLRRSSWFSSSSCWRIASTWANARAVAIAAAAWLATMRSTSTAAGGQRRADEHTQHAQQLAPAGERQPGEACDAFGAHPVGVADLGIARGIGHQHRRAARPRPRRP